MLKVRGLAAAYGASRVLFDISLDVGAGEVVTLLGRNGMGKTTTIRAIMGLLAAQSGSIEFKGQPVRNWPADRIARLGIGLVPEGRLIFPTLSVRENLVATAADRHGAKNPWTLARIFALFPRLDERQSQSGRTLSGGEQQMLAIGRALMTNPDLLILDEATEGLAPVIRAEIWQCLEALKAEGQSILLVDKNIAVLERLADRHHVIEKGRTIWAGARADFARDRAEVHRHVAF
ncbi:MAG: ABC transporter ATP-binding protein [Beijerinckiaceae bacterium]|nr:ABC transporter ATP-binding protein [Beijerinckiaceae bacterium]MDO9439409.1 ABC transporter ATP-binding protein [Beijerinckiaceae bacterium]